MFWRAKAHFDRLYTETKLYAKAINLGGTPKNELAGTDLTVTGAELNLLDDVCASVSIALATSATTDGIDVTITVLDAAGVAIDAVHELEIWISEAATGIGLTADSYSGDVTFGANMELQEIVTKKHYKALTNASGVCTFTMVDSANPADQYVVVKNPVTGKLHVSAASGTTWEGAA